MKTLIPNVDISLEGDSSRNYKLLEFTINPIFGVQSRWSKSNLFGKLRPWPSRNFKVWIELVLGHEDNNYLPLPKVIFEFSSAFRFSDKQKPPVIDKDEGFDRSNNFKVYKHLWIDSPHGDLIKMAFGEKSKRVMPIDYKGIYNEKKAVFHSLEKKYEFLFKKVQAGLAFTRSGYTLDKRHQYSERINYPCTFKANAIQPSDKVNRIETNLMPFSINNLKPNPRTIEISRFESISFWYNYPYTELTAPYADDERTYRFSFLQLFSIHMQLSNSFWINSFPRLPFRYEVTHNDPELITAPPLPLDPPTWVESSSEPMYPLKLANPEGYSPSIKNVVKQNKPIRFFISIKDISIQRDKDLAIIILGLIFATFAQIVIPKLEGILKIFVSAMLILLFAYSFYRIHKNPRRNFKNKIRK